MSKKTGLGTNAFFASTEDEKTVETPVVEQPKAAKPKPPKKVEKVRTTVTLYPHTLAAMELLKAEARKDGVKATFSDVLGDAIDLLMKKKKLSVE